MEHRFHRPPPPLHPSPMLVGEMFFEILVGETKRGSSMLCSGSVGELVEAGQFFLNELQK